ncbi:hypothetical protein QOZ88_03990 [Blastococcus sp. BMG 814]|uniref:Uncharacterized protein n=1 Tax=Blastococcus carthaginiensis TaxID=3050034 RepID=A0ABT9I8A0_9ACTN|nr:hypothetical protein [Blastococcus carthaginiensis]
MFFLPAAIFAGVPDIGWDDTLLNWLLAGAGNPVGAVVFVATSYWYLFLRDEPEPFPEEAAAKPAERGRPGPHRSTPVTGSSCAGLRSAADDGGRAGPARAPGRGRDRADQRRRPT